MLVMMFMLLALVMMKLEQVPTCCSDSTMSTPTVNYIECPRQAFLYCGPTDRSVAECNVEDKPVDGMPNVTRLKVEGNAFY